MSLPLVDESDQLIENRGRANSPPRAKPRNTDLRWITSTGPI